MAVNSHLEIDPPPNPFNDVLPFFGVPHHNRTAFLIIFIDSHRQNVLAGFDIKFLVDLVFNWQAMTIPAEAPSDMMTRGAGISGNNILKRTVCVVSAS